MHRMPYKVKQRDHLLKHSSNKVLDLIDYWVPTAPRPFRSLLYNLLLFSYISIPLLTITIGVLLYLSFNPQLSSFIGIVFSFIILPLSLALVMIIYYLTARGYSIYKPENTIEHIPYKVSEYDSLIIPFKSTSKYSSITISDPTNNIYELPYTIKHMLYASSNDIHRIFLLLHGGRENRPLVRLTELKYNSEAGSITFITGNASYIDFWYVHHFADFAIARRVSKESKSRLWSCSSQRSKDKKLCEQFVTIRSTLYPYLMDYYSRLAFQDIETPSGIRLRVAHLQDGSFKTAPILPNGLGITGIVRLIDKENPSNDVLLLQRRSRGQVDRGRLQWSFAGLVGSFDDLFERRNYTRDHYHTRSDSSDLTLLDLCWEELQDEILVPIELDNVIHPIDSSFGVSPIALILNAEKLFQPELAVEVKIAIDPDVFQKLHGRFPMLDQVVSQPASRFALLNTADIGKPDEYSATISRINDITRTLNIKPRYLFSIILEMYRMHNEWT